MLGISIGKDSGDGCDHNQTSKKVHWTIEKNYNFVTNIYVVPL
jgi:hypothetical protein